MVRKQPSNTHQDTYEGRSLPRPHDEIVDQGLAFDVGTLLSRRKMLTFFGLGAATVGLAACGGGNSGTTAASTSTTAAASGLTEIPDETAGPYPGDGSNGPDVLEQSGIVRSDIRSSFGDASATAEGIPMTLELSLADLAAGGVPFAGTAVYVWHCNREGGYSLYSEGITEENYLRGVQIADATERCGSPVSSRRPIPADGPTSTSRCTRTKHPSRTPPMPSPPLRWLFLRM